GRGWSRQRSEGREAKRFRSSPLASAPIRNNNQINRATGGYSGPLPRCPSPGPVSRLVPSQVRALILRISAARTGVTTGGTARQLELGSLQILNRPNLLARKNSSRTIRHRGGSRWGATGGLWLTACYASASQSKHGGFVPCRA